MNVCCMANDSRFSVIMTYSPCPFFLLPFLVLTLPVVRSSSVVVGARQWQYFGCILLVQCFRGEIYIRMNMKYSASNIAIQPCVLM